MLNIIHAARWLWQKFARTFRSTTGRIRWALCLIVVITIASAFFDYPRPYNYAVDKLNAQIKRIDQVSLPNKLSWLKQVSRWSLPRYPDQPFRLGLDLVGGTQLLYDADTTRVAEADRKSSLEGVRDVIERRVNAFGVAEPLVQTNRSGNQWRVLVELAGVKNVDDAIKQIGETPLLEFKEPGAAPAKVSLTAAEQKEIDDSEKAGKAKIEGILLQLNKGADFAALAKQNSEDPGSKDNGGEYDFMKLTNLDPSFGAALSALATGERTKVPIKSSFGYHVIEKLDTRGTGAETEVKFRHILVAVKSANDFLPPTDSNGNWNNTALSGKQLSSAIVIFDQQSGQPQVSLEFNDEGAKLFAEITKRNVGKSVGIFLDNQPISIPTVQQEITGGKAVITGSFSIQEAKLLVQRLNAGALPVPITLVGQETVGASLGQVAVDRSLRAGLFGFLLVALFMLIYYRLPGLLAVTALLIYTALTLAIFKLWPVTLTLAGIAGFILSIGMAVDANVLIFERLKEELRRGKSLPIAVSEGFARAWTSIRDSNASSLITCIILYWFGSSVVQGFALTLAIGILVSMFSAITITRTFLRVVVRDRHALRLWLYGINRHEIITQ